MIGLLSDHFHCHPLPLILAALSSHLSLSDFSKMKNEIKKSWQGSFKLFYSLLLLVMLHVAASATPPVTLLTCPGPTVSKTGQSSGYVAYSWNTVSGATAYEVRYVRKEDNYTSSVISTGNTSITFSGLAPGTYAFFFVTVCGGELSETVIIDDLIIL